MTTGGAADTDGGAVGVPPWASRLGPVAIGAAVVGGVLPLHPGVVEVGLGGSGAPPTGSPLRVASGPVIVGAFGLESA